MHEAIHHEQVTITIAYQPFGDQVTVSVRQDRNAKIHAIETYTISGRAAERHTPAEISDGVAAWLLGARERSTEAPMPVE